MIIKENKSQTSTVIKQREKITKILFADIVRYRNGYLSLRQLKETVLFFAVELAKVTKNLKNYIYIFFLTIRDIYRLSPGLGLVLNGVMFYLIIRRTFLRPLFWIMKNFILPPFLCGIRHVELSRVRRSLKQSPDGINVLCLIPKVVVGGSEKVMLDIVNGLKLHNYHFHLFAAQGEKNDWCLNFLKKFDNIVMLKEMLIYDQYAIEKYLDYLKSLIKTLNVEIILISNTLMAYTSLPQIKAEFPNIKIVDLLHAKHLLPASDKMLWAVPYVDQRVCISREVKVNMEEKYRLNKINECYLQRLIVIYNGNDMTKFQRQNSLIEKFKAQYAIAKDIKIISFIGRLHPEKRPSLFVDIAKHILTRYSSNNIMFVMAGGGEELQLVKELIHTYGIENNFILTGMINSDHVQELLADTYALLIVSEREGLPLIMVEAMSMNIPVISTDVGATREVITHGVNGFLVHSQDNIVENVASLLIQLLTSTETYQRISQNSRQALLEKFSLENMINQYIELFDSVRASVGLTAMESN